jgi:hypothetical protein
MDITKLAVPTIAIIALVGFIVATIIGIRGTESAQADASQSVEMRWEMLAGTGETPAEFASNHPNLYAIYHWNPELGTNGAYEAWFPNVPDYVNSIRPIHTLEPTLGYWFGFYKN